MNLDIYEYTNIGGRDENQDAVSYSWDGKVGLFTVADGLGGHSGGALASKLVSSVFQSRWEEYLVSPISLTDWFTEQVEYANSVIVEGQLHKKNHMKSTLVSLAITEHETAWINVGDSRLYFMQDGAIKAISSDHSVSFKKHMAGEISRDQINHDEDRSRLLRSIGGSQEIVPQVRVSEFDLRAGSGFLLCSDGFWEYVYDTEMLLDYCTANSAKEWVDLMLLRALPRLPKNCDNMTALAVIIE